MLSCGRRAHCAGDAALLPKPQENKSWETAWQKISPKVEAREKELVQELEELRARERCDSDRQLRRFWRTST